MPDGNYTPRAAQISATSHMQQIAKLEGHTHGVSSFVELSDGRIVSASLDTHLRIYNLRTMKCERVIQAHLGAALAVAEIPDGRIVSGSADGTIRVWDVETGSCDCRLESPSVADGQRYSVTLLEMLSGGKLISGDESGALWQWDIEEFENPTEKVIHEGFVAFHDKPSAAVALPVGKPKKSKTDPALGHARGVTRVEELPNGKVLTGGWDGHCKLWIRPEPTKGDPHAAEWNVEWNAKGQSPILLSETKLACVAYGDMNSRNCLWFYEIEYDEESDPETKTPPKLIRSRTMIGHQGAVVGAIKLDRDQILSYSEDMTIRLWSSRNFQCKLVLKGHEGKVTSVQQLKHGKYKGCLLSSSWDKTLRLWPNPKHIT